MHKWIAKHRKLLKPLVWTVSSCGSTNYYAFIGSECQYRNFSNTVVYQVKHIYISCWNSDVQQVPERMVQLEGMSMKHRNEVSQAEKNLLETLASQTNLRSLPDENNGANLEYGKSHCDLDRQKTPLKRHPIDDIETSASAGTSTQQVRNSNCECYHFKSH